MTRSVYTIGYQGRSIEEISAVVDQLDAILVDIRFSPRSRRPELNLQALRRRC